MISGRVGIFFVESVESNVLSICVTQIFTNFSVCKINIKASHKGKHKLHAVFLLFSSVVFLQSINTYISIRTRAQLVTSLLRENKNRCDDTKAPGVIVRLNAERSTVGKERSTVGKGLQTPEQIVCPSFTCALIFQDAKYLRGCPPPAKVRSASTYCKRAQHVRNKNTVPVLHGKFFTAFRRLAREAARYSVCARRCTKYQHASA